jgi:hypothetical protein
MSGQYYTPQSKRAASATPVGGHADDATPWATAAKAQSPSEITFEQMREKIGAADDPACRTTQPVEGVKLATACNVQEFGLNLPDRECSGIMP